MAAGSERVTRASSAKQRGNYVDCACRIVELIGLVASNKRVSCKVSKSRSLENVSRTVKHQSTV